MKFKDKTRGGYPVRILATDLPGPLPILAVVFDWKEGTSVRLASDGRKDVTHADPYDLIPDITEPRKVVRWAYVQNPETQCSESPEEALIKKLPWEKGVLCKVTIEWTPE